MSEPKRIIHDDPEGLGASLVRAALDERPGSHAKRKALVGLGLLAGSTTAASSAGAALSTTHSAGALSLTVFAKWLGVGVVVGVATVGGAVAVEQAAEPRSQSPSAAAAPNPSTPPSGRVHPAEPSVPETVGTPATVVSTPARNKRIAPSGATAASPAPARLAPPASAMSGPSALAAELALVDGARAALRAGRAQQALRLLDRRDAEHPRGAFAIESTVLRIEALSRVGERSRAIALGGQFLDRHPNSPLAQRVRASIEGDSP